jgi:2-oxoglutarate ferredoxin oxidoreductase subunit alpha
MVEGALAAGCRFFAGYPITPASEIAESMAARLPPLGGIFLQMEDEIAGICAAIGAAFAGELACTASSGPGVSLMQEGVGYAAMVEAPIVIINVMRGGPATGMPTASSQQDILQAKWGAHGDYEIIALMPSSCQEAFELVYKAFSLAMRFRVPVYVLADAIVGHTREKVTLPASADLPPIRRPRPASPPGEYVAYRPGPDGLLDGMPAFNEGYRLLIEGQAHGHDGRRAGHLPDVAAELGHRLVSKITRHADELVDVKTAMLDDAEVAVVCFGSPARPAMQAVRDARGRGVKAGLFQIRTIWPFPAKQLAELAGRVHRLVVPEMNVGRIADEVRHAVAGRAEVVSLPKLGGILHRPDEILAALVTEAAR